MTISFDSIPSNLRTPFVAVEFNASLASQGPVQQSYRVLLVGQKVAAGTAPVDTALRVTSENDVITLAGRGSMLHRMAVAYFSANRETETWIGVLADNAAGVAATSTITATGPATAAGTVTLYVGGAQLTIGVNAGDTATVIATAVAAAINANPDLAATATAAAAVVTLTARHKGLAGNDINARVNYNAGEVLPAGVTVVFAAGVAGTSNPTLTNLIAALGDVWFNIIAHPYTDATNLAALETELSSRYGAMRSIDGVAITSAAGTFSALATLGQTRNSKSSTILAQAGINPLTPPAEFAAEAAGLVAKFGAEDPARPFQTLAFTHALPPAATDLFDQTERNMLLYDGISTSVAVDGGGVALERLITTYRTSPSGATDTAYLDVTTLLTLSYLRFSFRNQIRKTYPRHKLADDGTRFGPGQAIITPSIGMAEAISWFRQMEQRGLVENFDDFKANLICERNVQDPNRLDWLLPPNLINQLIVGAAQIQFRL